MAVQHLQLGSEGEQEALGARLAAASADALLVFLEGDLGAGKTTLTRGFLRGLGHRGAVKSPTFTLVEPYEIGGRKVYHLDLYRVADPGELEYLGLREMLDQDATLLIEWAERGEGWLPPPDLRIVIRHRGLGRDLELQALSAAAEAVLDRLGANL